MLLSDFRTGVKYGMIEGDICDYTNTYRLTNRWQAMYHYTSEFLDDWPTGRFRKAAFGMGFWYGRRVRDGRPRFEFVEMGGRQWIKAS